MSYVIFSILTSGLILKAIYTISVYFYNPIERVRWVAFLKLFSVSLTTVLLPKYLLQLSQGSVLSASSVYAIYQIGFFIMLLPSGWLADSRYIKLIFILASAIEAILFIAFGWAHALWVAAIIQAIFGLIVPLSTAAEYAYIFNFSTPLNLKNNIAKYMQSIKSGMLSGLFLGGILLKLLSAKMLFSLAGIALIMSSVFILIFLPALKHRASSPLRDEDGRPVFDGYRENEYAPHRFFSTLKILLSIALPLGILQEGVILFGLPIIFFSQPYQQTSEMIILFTLGFFMSNYWVAKRSKTNAKSVSGGHEFFIGLLGVGIILILIQYFPYKILLLCLGLFSGLLITPSIAGIARTNGSKNKAYATYRLFETIGRSIGPSLIAFLMLLFPSRYFLILGGIWIVLALITRVKFSITDGT